MPPGKIENMVAPRRDGFDFDIDSVDSPVGIHVQLRNEAAAARPILIFAIEDASSGRRSIAKRDGGCRLSRR